MQHGIFSKKFHVTCKIFRKFPCIITKLTGNYFPIFLNITLPQRSSTSCWQLSHEQSEVEQTVEHRLRKVCKHGVIFGLN